MNYIICGSKAGSSYQRGIAGLTTVNMGQVLSKDAPLSEIDTMYFKL